MTPERMAEIRRSFNEALPAILEGDQEILREWAREGLTAQLTDVECRGRSQ